MDAGQRYILSALTNVHRVIDELDMDVTVLEEDADGKAFSDLLKATMADGDRRLRALGFDITSILHVAACAKRLPEPGRNRQ